MDVNAILQAVSNLGFPIACVLLMFRQLAQEQENHKLESKEWTTAINNNTLVMQKLVDRLDGEKND